MLKPYKAVILYHAILSSSNSVFCVHDTLKSTRKYFEACSSPPAPGCPHATTEPSPLISAKAPVVAARAASPCSCFRRTGERNSRTTIGEYVGRTNVTVDDIHPALLYGP